eukprot:2480087-Amphidinium_carterae.4
MASLIRSPSIASACRAAPQTRLAGAPRVSVTSPTGIAGRASRRANCRVWAHCMISSSAVRSRMLCHSSCQGWAANWNADCPAKASDPFHGSTCGMGSRLEYLWAAPPPFCTDS